MALSATALVTRSQAKNFIHKDPASSLHVFAEYVGVGDGNDTTFSLDNTPVSGSLRLYVNNSLQTEVTEYTISGAGLTFITAPPLNHGITADYDYAAASDTFEEWDDDLIDILINAATKKCEDFCRRAFVRRAITENRIGDGGARVVLNKKPVSSLTSVTLAGSTMTEDTDFTLYDSEGVMLRPAGVSFWTDDIHAASWTNTAKIVISYEAGYADTVAATQALVPEAVTAVLVAVANWYENRLGLISETVAGVGAQSYALGDMPAQSKKLLSGLDSGFGVF